MTRICRCCGFAFTPPPRGTKKVFCSSACRARYAREHPDDPGSHALVRKHVGKWEGCPGEVSLAGCEQCPYDDCIMPDDVARLLQHQLLRR